MLSIILPVFLIIILGYAIGKYKQINIDSLVWLIIYITSPALLFASLVKSDINLDELGNVAFAASLVILSMFFIVLIIFKLRKKKLSGMSLPLIFGNTGYLGFPIALLAFQYEGLSRAVVYSTMESFIMFSLGIYIAAHKESIKEIVRLPLLPAIALAIVVKIFQIPIPGFILEPTDMLGMATIPLALIVLGIRLTAIKVGAVTKSVLMSVFKIGVGFAIALTVIHFLPLSLLAKKIVILQAAMPSAVFTLILCEQYHTDCDITASTVFISTLISMLTIPAVLWYTSVF